MGQKLELNLEKNNIINDGRSVLNVVQKRETFSTLLPSFIMLFFSRFNSSF